MDKGSKYNKYGSDKELPTTFSLWEVYQYSDQLLKHMPTNALKTIQKTHLFSRNPVYFADTSFERRNHNAANIDFTGLSTAERTLAKKNYGKDLNIDERISLFKNQLKSDLFIESPSDRFQILEKLIFRQKSTIE